MTDGVKTHNATVAYIALIIAIIALIIGYLAYNRSGVDLEDQIQREVSEAVVNLENAAQNTEEVVRNESAEALEGTSDALDRAATDARTDDDGPEN